MKFNLLLFVSTLEESMDAYCMMKSFESTIRPMMGDIIEDPGFDSQFHNGYEVVKVTINYAQNESWVSLTPLAIELQEIPVKSYIEKLEQNGWSKVTEEQFSLF